MRTGMRNDPFVPPSQVEDEQTSERSPSKLLKRELALQAEVELQKARLRDAEREGEALRGQLAAIVGGGVGERGEGEEKPASSIKSLITDLNKENEELETALRRSVVDKSLMSCENEHRYEVLEEQHQYFGVA